jgi:hypothetical protein
MRRVWYYRLGWLVVALLAITVVATCHYGLFILFHGIAHGG